MKSFRLGRWMLGKGIKTKVENSIMAARFNEDPFEWHVYNHDEYIERFQAAWERN
jgi:hypothetical protein